MRTPIFDRMLRENPKGPICTICGRTWLKPFEAYGASICGDCYMQNRHCYPQLWHCRDCGEFLGDGMNRMQMVSMVAGDSPLMFLCREHFNKRQAAKEMASEVLYETGGLDDDY